jgi:hypothetical protein
MSWRPWTDVGTVWLDFAPDKSCACAGIEDKRCGVSYANTYIRCSEQWSIRRCKQNEVQIFLVTVSTFLGVMDSTKWLALAQQACLHLLLFSTAC